MKTTEVAIGIVLRGGQVLICRRRSDAALAGYWEFPGGKVETGESVADCLHRELREELGIQVRIREPLSSIEHTYPQGKVLLYPFVCDHVDGEATPLASAELRWTAPAELANYEFPAANDDLIKRLIESLRSPASN